MTSPDVFRARAESKTNGHGHKTAITCRVISIDEAELLKALHINNADGAARWLYRRLHKRHPDLTPRDIAVAVREVRLKPELWVDAIAARLDTLKPLAKRHPRLRRRMEFRLPTQRRRVPLGRPVIIAAE